MSETAEKSTAKPLPSNASSRSLYVTKKHLKEFILSRMLNLEIINLGFSENGQLDYEIAELMEKCDASLYILDFMPNVSVAQIHEKTEKFYRILRDKQPDTPIMFIEEPIFPHTKYDLNIQSKVHQLNRALHEVFDNLKAKGERNIFLIPSTGMIETNSEATVDGIHFTDLGFMRYARYLYPKIQKNNRKSAIIFNICPS